MARACSSCATWATAFSKPSSPRSSCSLSSNCSPRRSCSFCQIVERGKEHRVLARLVRAVHADEGLQRTGETCAIARVADGRRHSQLENVLGHRPTCSVLLAQDGDQIHELPRLLEPREQLRLFQLLVIALDEAPDEARRQREHIDARVLLSLQPPCRLVVDEQHAVEDAVLAHEVLAGRDFFLLLRLRLPSRGIRRQGGQDDLRTRRSYSYQHIAPLPLLHVGLSSRRRPSNISPNNSRSSPRAASRAFRPRGAR